MRQFTSKPIVIMDEEKVLDILELDYSYDESPFHLKILKDDTVIHDNDYSDSPVLELDVSLKDVQFIYTDLVSGELLLKKTINLESFDISDEVISLMKSEKLEKERFVRISEIIKDELDSPEGTPIEIELHTKMLNTATMNAKARRYTEDKIRQIIQRDQTIPDEFVESYTNKIYSEFYGMGVLQELDDDKDVGEIAVNGFVHPYFRCEVYYWKKGKKLQYEKTFDSLESLKNVYSRAIAFARKELNSVENAMVEATRANRDRVNIIIPDASESWALNIRKFGNFVPTEASMKKFGTVNDEIGDLLEIFVKGKANIGIGGEMGTGKTTFINYLLTYTEKLERKCVIASVAETDVERVLKGHDVLVFNVDEEKGFTFRNLIRASLRTTSDRVIIPESRGDEFRQVYEANLKTKGNMFTAHALTDYEFLDMCVDMYNGDSSNADIVSVKNKIAKAVDVLVIMRKVGSDIRIKSISEIILNDETKDFERMNPLWIWVSDPEDNTKGYYEKTGNKISEMTKARLNEYGVAMSVMAHL